MKEVGIIIRSEQGDAAPTVTVYRGRYYRRGGCCHVLWEEEQEGLKSHVWMKYTAGAVEVRRTGDLAYDLHFDTGRRTRTQYRTPAGTIHLVVDTREVVSVYAAEGLRIRTAYALYAGDVKLQDSVLEITVRGAFETT